jgi:flavodoxin I
MKNVVLIYWGTGGNVENAARKIASTFKPEEIDLFNLKSFDLTTLKNYKLIILGGATVGAEIWMDVRDDNEWSRFFVSVKEYDLSGKFVAFFGLGDQVLYPGHFVDALGIFKEELEPTNATIIGKWPTDGYDFRDSDGYDGKMFYGLALDEDRQAELTVERATRWRKQLMEIAGL